MVRMGFEHMWPWLNASSTGDLEWPRRGCNDNVDMTVVAPGEGRDENLHNLAFFVFVF